MTTQRTPVRTTRRAALALFAGLLVIYNLNGREIGSVDSQPTKLAARALARDGTLALDRDVADQPQLAPRPSFARDRDGHYRSAYSVVPSIIAAMPAWLLARTGLIDLDAPLAPGLIAVLTASALTAVAVVLVFLSLARTAPKHIAMWTAIGLGLGTNYWTIASRTLWQHETVAFGLALALWAWWRPVRSLGPALLAAGGVGLALAITARLQLAPIAAVMLVWMAVRCGVNRALLPAAIVAAGVLALLSAQYMWFGHPFGATPQLEALHPTVHGVPDAISRAPWIGALGLLISPSRGVLVFSPIVLLAVLGVARPAVRTADRNGDPAAGWLVAAAAAQFAAYACYGVWWGGFTYGPRYMLDLLVPLAPAAAIGLDTAWARGWSRGAAAVLVAWSVAVAGTGAWVYPNERWNTDPNSVDLNHARLWDWRDSQIVRCWQRGLSPQNFDLFERGSIRPGDPPR